MMEAVCPLLMLAGIRSGFSPALISPTTFSSTGQMCQICRAHSKAIAGRTRKRWKVAICHNRFGQHTARSAQQIHRFR